MYSRSEFRRGNEGPSGAGLVPGDFHFIATQTVSSMTKSPTGRPRPVQPRWRGCLANGKIRALSEVIADGRDAENFSSSRANSAIEDAFIARNYSFDGADFTAAASSSMYRKHDERLLPNGFYRDSRCTRIHTRVRVRGENIFSRIPHPKLLSLYCSPRAVGSSVSNDKFSLYRPVPALLTP